MVGLEYDGFLAALLYLAAFSARGDSKAAHGQPRHARLRRFSPRPSWPLFGDGPSRGSSGGDAAGRTA